MSDAPNEVDPRRLFRAAVVEKMLDGHLKLGDLSAATNIPENRLLAITGDKPGAALLSDLVALALYFDVSIDSFFT